MLVADGNYEASLLLADEIWQSKQIPVKGDYVVAIPSRDTLLITGSEDVENLAKIKELATSTAKDSPYRRTGRSSDTGLVAESPSEPINQRSGCA